MTSPSNQAWLSLLVMNPVYNRFSGWEEIRGSILVDLLYGQPQFAEYVILDTLDGWDWSCLLSVRSEFADQCNWGLLDAVDWHHLLSHCPQFVSKCDLSAFSELDRGYLTTAYPSLFAT